MKSKYGDNIELCYMDTEFLMHIKTEDFYKYIADDVEKRFDTPNYDDECERPLAKGKNKKVIGKVKADDGGSDKKAKGTKK